MTASAPGPWPHELAEVAEELRDVLIDSTVEVDRNVGELTTYRVGGSARVFVVVESSEDLAALLSVLRSHDVATVVIGKGSNLLVADRGFDGLALQLGEAFAEVELLGDGLVRLGGAASLPVAARRVTAAGLTGFEWAVGVPGTVGGAVRMNAGGHGSDMAAAVVAARVVDLGEGVVVDMTAPDLRFGYRSSAIAADQVVVSADLQLRPGDLDLGQGELAEIVAWRRQHQPGGQNAGSVFTNPPGDSAGRLIDAAGLKGLRVGTAEVSTKHANFIQSDPDGNAADIVALMGTVVDRVLEHAGIRLHPETRLLGFDDDLIDRLISSQEGS